MHDTLTGETESVSISSSGADANHLTDTPSISAESSTAGSSARSVSASVPGSVEVLPAKGAWQGLNSVLHLN